uniref:Uncharacterized protein n=2 Tax=Heterosigma akashiwo TaxID=2829 RepID=A0A7S4D697_HETAK
MLGPTPTVSASVSFSFPLQFFFRPELLPFGVGQGLGAGRRATTVKRLGVTRSWLWTPDKGLRAAWSPWFFLLPGARAIFQFLRACLLWAVVIYDRIIHRRATRRGVGGSEGHPQRVSLKGRFPTLYRMRRWTGGKTSGVGYSFSWRPGMARPSSSAMLNFEPFFAGKKKRLKSEEIEMLEHDLLQESEDWRDQLRAKEEAEKSATTKHTEQQSGAWYEQHSVARSRVIQLGKEEEMNWPQQESGKSAPADPHDDYFVRRQDEFNQELASISDAVGSAEQYYSRHTWHKPEGETHHVDHWFNPMSRQRSRVEKWYTSHEHYIVNAALQSSEFVQNLASSGPASVIVARDEYDENRGEGYKT